MSASRPGGESEQLTSHLLRLLGADSVQRVLEEAVALMASLVGAPAAAAFTIEADQVLEEAWQPGVELASEPIGRQLRSFALQSVRSGEPLSLPPREGIEGAIRVVLLRAQGRSLGAVALWSSRARVATAAQAAQLEQLERFVAEAVVRQRREASMRATAEQQKRWFGQLDQQVRVLDRERQKFAAIVNQADLYAYVVDPTSVVRWVNRTMSANQPPPEGASWPGRTCRDVCTRFAAVENECQHCPVVRALASNQPVHHEMRGELAGRARTLYVTALPIRGVDGRPQEVLVMMQDLTDLGPLKRVQEQLHAVISNAPIVLFAIDAAGRFTLSEGHGLEALGLQPGQMVGQSAFDAYRDVPRIVENLRRALAGEDFTDVVDVGPLAFETRYTPLRDETGQLAGVIGIATDVSQRRRLEDEARQSLKLEALGRLAGGVAHDFNDSLTTILGYCTLLQHRQPGDGESRRCLAEVRQAAERAAGLTRQLLVFSRRPLPESPSGEFDASATSTRELMRRLLSETPEAQAAPDTNATAPAARTGSPGPTLLLVEDEASVRAIAREMLVASGFSVLEAATGPEALALARRASQTIDLVITDVVLPGMSGAELADRLRAEQPALRVLFTSGHSDEAISRLGVSHTDPSFLQKPFTYEAFVEKVRGALASGPIVDGAPRWAPHPQDGRAGEPRAA
jgi:PAS domain S-box-containing protein